LVHSVIRRAGARGRGACNHVGAFFERAPVKRHEPEATTQFEHLYDAVRVE